MDGATTIFAFLGQTTDLILQHTNMGTTNLALPQLWPSEYQALPCNTAAWLIDPRRTSSKAYTPSIIKKVAQLRIDTDVHFLIIDKFKFRKN
jgi:hypothetical protein